MTTLYIAGSITHGGTVTDEAQIRANLQAFHDAQRRLEGAGYAVLNPARHDYDPGKSWADYMRLGLTDVLVADGLALLDGWGLSEGARLEVDVADALGVPARSLRRWLGSAS